MFANACSDVKVRSLSRFGKQGPDGDFFELVLEHPDETSPAWKNWKPGQFIMVRPTRWEHNPLWGRPFSIYRAGDGILSVFFQVVGRGTEKLTQLAPGDNVTVWGPLGNTFVMDENRKTLILAGGIGMAPFAEYVERHSKPENVQMIFGHRPPVENYPFSSIADKIKATSCREQKPEDLQNFIALLEKTIPEYCPDGLIVACGPTPFLKTVQRVAADHGGRAQISLENRMACGVGACLGCVCEHKDKGPVSVCSRGPVFWSDEITF
ncbi:dihydroorotate dehydrogenase electron transfer subunit [Desulfobaculum bizertense]|uniref:Dihydroorotate oxidase B, electron transfer subunit n=1 Tax=Desulfobaculum bizertense DSM 18034 TaxID=1121442 RepID=A0A1T4WF71_9BACT|nr:dihydroorotate dehydrogenase electron transfer subunit [Desulfobaculum bizertense]UIJ36694.1 dihydroorotate dehydrogenase electron transfer subunit [Desulfobaculum bizertense]SKA75827.1 dihydroorotate oxidase B, electron transfer subunit [Desulfobaculum bizertense DSM 18034]